MNNFSFHSPTFFSFGTGTEQEAGVLVRRFGGTKVLVHYGSGSVLRSGLLDTVLHSLQAAGLSYIELGGVKPNPRSGLVYEGIDLCKQHQIDFILAVGGGSVIDSAKAIALGTQYDGDFWDFYKNKWFVENALPIGTILTIAAAGSEGSSSSVITHEDGMWKRDVTGEVLRPKFSILNPELTCTLPAYQTACGITDIMAHICERYFTNTKDVEVTDRLCEALLKAIIAEAPKVMADPNDYQARANIMWAGMLAHNDLCGTGRSQDWNSHGIEHELSALYDVAHGAGLAVIMPTWMKYVMKHDIMRFAQFAVRVWNCDMDFENPAVTALAGITCFRAFLSSIGMPATFLDIGAREEDIPLLVQNLGVTEENKRSGFVTLGPKDAEAIYRMAL